MKTINGQQWKLALVSGVNAMKNNTERINALNVFPVPDGDTGSNMSATAEYAGNEISSLSTTNLFEISNKFSRGMLLGARGNSGVILSQIFKGFSVAFEGKESVNAFELVAAFESARVYAYKSVMKPIEGTILTVIRMISENLQKAITPSNSIEQVFEAVVKFARKACDETPNLLPVLKEVGVTDSGGEGLFLIFEGMYNALIGKPVEVSNVKQSVDSFLMEGESFEGEFGYCTEFIVSLKSVKHFDKSKFENALTRMGTSIAVVTDEDIVKVHIHTVRPGNVLTFAQKFGEFIKIKSENMTLQANESRSAKAEKTTSAAVAPTSNEKLNIGVISCNTGQGIIEDMVALGTDFVIEAGQTMNPSAKDFMEAIEKLNTDKIIILPNNSNIILVAQQVAQTSEKEIIIIPSKTQMQGLSAMMLFDREASIESNQENMEDAIGNVKTGMVTFASRTTKIEGVQVREGEYLAIADKKILKSTKSKVQSAKEIVDELISKETEIVTIYWGEESTEVDANEIASYIETNYDVEIEVKEGGQPIYHFLIAFE